MRLLNWKTLMIMVMMAVLVACGGAESSDSDTGDNGASSGGDITETETLTLNLGGTTYLVDAPDSWRNLGGASISNLEITIQSLTALPLNDFSPEEAVETYGGSVEIESLTVTEFDDLTVYTDVAAEDVYLIFNDTYYQLNVSTIGDAEFSTYADEVTQILGTLRPE